MRRRRKGSALVLVVILAVFLGGIMASLASLQISLMQRERQASLRERAYRLAEAGIERGLQNIGHNAAFTGSDSVSVPCADETCSYTYNVTGNPPSKTVSATGTIVKNGTAVERSIDAVINITGTSYEIISWAED